MIRDARSYKPNFELPFLIDLICLAGVVGGWIAEFNRSLGTAILVVAWVSICVWLSVFKRRWLLLLIVIMSPLIPTSFGYYLLENGGLVVTPTRVAIMILFAAFAAATLRNPILRRRFPLFKMFLFYIGVLALGLLFAPDKTGALIQLLGEAGLVTAVLTYIAYCLIRTRRQLDQLVTVLLISGVLIVLTGLWEWFTQRSFKANVMLPLIGNNSEILQAIELKSGQIPRITGTLDNPLALAGYMILLLPLALQRAILGHGIARLISWGIVVLIGVALLLSFGRIAQFAGVLETLFLSFFYRKKGSSWLFSALIILGVGALLPLYANVTEGGGVNSTLLVPIYTIERIAQRWLDLGQAFIQNPRALFVGFGFTRFDMTNMTSGGRLALLYSRMDTDVLRILAVTGVLGFVSWLGLFQVFFKWVVKNGRQHYRLVVESPILPLATGIAGAFITALPGASILTYTQTWPVVGVLMGATLGFLTESWQSNTEAIEKPTPLTYTNKVKRS